MKDPATKTVTYPPPALVPQESKAAPPAATLALHPPSDAVQHPTLETLLDRVRAYAEAGDEDLAGIERAYHFAAKAHAPQKRESGEPYVLLGSRVRRLSSSWTRRPCRRRCCTTPWRIAPVSPAP